MKEEIKVIIDREGRSTIEVLGARGSQCLSMTGNLEQEIGQVIERRRKGEFYQTGRLHSENSIHQKDLGD
jgi:hypothetical protein